jgi:hypothetical protein
MQLPVGRPAESVAKIFANTHTVTQLSATHRLEAVAIGVIEVPQAAIPARRFLPVKIKAASSDPGMPSQLEVQLRIFCCAHRTSLQQHHDLQHPKSRDTATYPLLLNMG